MYWQVSVCFTWLTFQSLPEAKSLDCDNDTYAVDQRVNPPLQFVPSTGLSISVRKIPQNPEARFRFPP